MPPDLTIGKLQKIARKYKATPKLRAVGEGLGSLVPFFGQAVHTYLMERLSQLERERVEALYAYLGESDAALTPDLIESDDFLHCFTITVRAAQRTRRNEKVRLFARLLASTTRDQEQRISDVDEYEELLGVLDDMSLREIRILTILEEREHTRSSSDSNPASLAEQIAEEMDIPEDEVSSVMTRLLRTGLYEEQIIQLWGGSSTRGQLTPRWYRLRDLIAAAGGCIL